MYTVEVSQLDQEVCKSVFKKTGKYDPQFMICAGAGVKGDACFGDEGGTYKKVAIARKSNKFGRIIGVVGCAYDKYE